MSWDGLIFRAPADTPVNDLPADFQLSPLGTTDQISDILRELFPRADHYQGQCCMVGDDYWLELNFGYPKDEDFRTAIGVRCNAGTAVIPVLQLVCEAFNVRLFDNQAGDFTDLSDDTQSSMAAFAAWRDRALRKSSRPADSE